MSFLFVGSQILFYIIKKSTAGRGLGFESFASDLGFLVGVGATPGTGKSPPLSSRSPFPLSGELRGLGFLGSSSSVAQLLSMELLVSDQNKIFFFFGKVFFYCFWTSLILWCGVN